MILAGKPGKTTRKTKTWVGGIKMDWIDLAKDRNQWDALMNT
jgi:hypothetical protein